MSTPPYALAELRFPFPALAALAGRAVLGGARETALALLLLARLAGDRVAAPVPAAPRPEGAAPPDARHEPTATDARPRQARADACRAWLGTLALPAAVRAPLVELAEAAGAGSAAALAAAVRRARAAATALLDEPSRGELDALADALHAAPAAPAAASPLEPARPVTPPPGEQSLGGRRVSRPGVAALS